MAADASEGEKYFFAVRPAGVGGGCSGKLGGARAATASGRWKPAGKEKPVVLRLLPRPCGGGSLLVGVKRAMTFAPRRKKKASSAALAAGWVMHEYRLAAPLHKNVSKLLHLQLVHAHPPNHASFFFLSSSSSCSTS